MRHLLPNGAVQGSRPGRRLHVEQQEMSDRGWLGTEAGGCPGITRKASLKCVYAAVSVLVSVGCLQLVTSIRLMELLS